LVNVLNSDQHIVKNLGNEGKMRTMNKESKDKPKLNNFSREDEFFSLIFLFYLNTSRFERTLNVGAIVVSDPQLQYNHNNQQFNNFLLILTTCDLFVSRDCLTGLFCWIISIGYEKPWIKVNHPCVSFKSVIS